MTDLTNATARAAATSGQLTILTADLKLAADPEFGDDSETRKVALQIRDEARRGIADLLRIEAEADEILRRL